MSDNTKEPNPVTLLASRAALFASTRAVTSDRAALRAAVCAYLAAEQARGSTVASVVQAVRRILAMTAEGAAQVSEELAQQLVDSCLEPHVPLFG